MSEFDMIDKMEATINRFAIVKEVLADVSNICGCMTVHDVNAKYNKKKAIDLLELSIESMETNIDKLYSLIQESSKVETV